MSKSEAPFVSVIVPHRGDDTRLVDCLKSLREQDYPRERFEIIIVLNESALREVAAHLAAGETLLWAPKGYSYAARNLGITRASGSILALTDSDCEPEKKWISEGVASSAYGEKIVAGRVLLSFASPKLTPPECFEKLFAFDQRLNASMGVSVFANTFIPLQYLKKLGHFMDNAISGEDFRWVRHAVESGIPLVYSHRSRVKHPSRATWAELRSKTQRRAIGHIPRSLSENSFASEAKRLLRATYRTFLRLPTIERRRASSTREQFWAYTVRLFVLFHSLKSITKSLVDNIRDVNPERLT